MARSGLWARLSLLALLPGFLGLAPAALCAAVGLAAGPGASAPLVIQGLGQGTVALDGKWQFKTGDDLAWAKPEFDDSAWEQIGVESGWGTQGHFAYQGFAWYRRHIDFVPVAGIQENLALIVFPYGGSGGPNGPFEVYWNGVLIGREGHVPPGPTWRFRAPAVSFGLGQPGSGVLAIRVWKPPLQFTDSGLGGGVYPAPLAGGAEAVATKLGDLDHIWLKNRQVYFDENLLYAILGILGFLAWMSNRSHKVLFWIAIFALTQPAHVLLFNAHIGLSWSLTDSVNMLVESVQSVSLWYLLLYLLELDGDGKLWRWTAALAVSSLATSLLDALVTGRDWSGPHGEILQIADGVIAIPVGLMQLFPLVLLWYAIGKRIGLASWLVAITASLVELIAVARITSIQGCRFTHWMNGYYFIQQRLFFIRGNYFDAENISVTLLLVAIVYAVYRYSVEQSERKSSLEQEFKSAQELQRILIPETLPPLKGYAVTSAYRPAQEVGGDFFQLIAQADGAALLVLGDVSGKGLKAAMTVSLLVGALRTMAEASSDPVEILAGMNRRLEGRMQNGFATCLVLRLEANGECAIANAGHLPPFLNGEEIALAGALPLGVVADAVFETASVHLGIGDRLTIYTDGLLEARSATGELYGFERVRTLIAARPDAQTVSDVAVGFGQDDDITVLTVTRLAVGVESTTLLAAPELLSVL